MSLPVIDSHTPDRGTGIAVLVGLGLSLLLGFLSDGVYHDDDLTHFLMARWSAWYPGYLLHIWGRPGMTLPAAAVSWIGTPEFGWHAARIVSALVTAATALLAAQTARRLSIGPGWLVVVACYALPLNMVLSYTTLTENFTAFYLMSGVTLLMRGRIICGALIFSLALLTRHEAVIFLPLWAICIWMSKSPMPIRLAAVALSLWAPIAHNVLHRIRFDRWPAEIFLRPSGSTMYLPTGWFAYVPDTLYAFSPVLCVLAVVGGIAMVRDRQPHVPAFATLFFMTHLAIKAIGVYASGGYGRFMIAVAPFVAIMAVRGLRELRLVTSRRPWCILALAWGFVWIACEVEIRAGRLYTPPEYWKLMLARSLAFVILALLSIQAIGLLRQRTVAAAGMSLMGLTLCFQWFFMVRPLELRPHHREIHGVVAWMRSSGLDERPFFSTSPWFAYFLGIVEHPSSHKSGPLLASMPVGTVFVWDSSYSNSDFHRIPESEVLGNQNYQLLRTIRHAEGDRLTLHVFEKIHPTPIPADREYYPRPMTVSDPPVRGIYYVKE